MARYVLKRIILMIPVLLGISLVIFTLMYISPGDPGTAILGMSVGGDAIREFNESVGFYDPFWVRYFNYVVDIIRLDFGSSYQNGGSVLAEIGHRFVPTLKVATFATLFSVLLGVPLGVLSAVKQYSVADYISRVAAITFVAVPPFWLGLMLMQVFALKLQWLPSFGVESWKSYVLPTLCLGFPYSARQLRMARSCVLDTIRQGYIRTARAKGEKESTVIWRHAFKNALLPIITSTAVQFGGLLGGALIAESVFSIPGLGSYLITGINQKDMPVVMGTCLVMAFCFSAVLLVMDIIYAFVDPRIKAKYSK
ncbi:MAG: ABC transporter permease [Ruminococcaceae bacterium]|nr:ABC transporter permease [Oscillospiraceae bacterium]